MDGVHLQTANSESYPNHDFFPASWFNDFDSLPMTFSFPENPNGEMIVKWEYDSYETCMDFEMNFQVLPPAGMLEIIYNAHHLEVLLAQVNSLTHVSPFRRLHPLHRGGPVRQRPHHQPRRPRRHLGHRQPHVPLPLHGQLKLPLGLCQLRSLQGCAD